MTTGGVRSFGELLRRQRVAAGLTQEELAERAGLSVRAVSDIERGLKSRPHRETVRLLAAALGLEGMDRAAFEAARGRTAATVPADGAGPDSGTPGRRGETLPPLVGRERELALLERHLAGVGPPALFLAGEPGIGKSRLLAEAARRAAPRGWAVLAGGCQRRSGQEPFAPLLEALHRYLQYRSPAELRADLRGCAWLVRLLPELAAGPIEPLPAWTVAPEHERRLMFAAVARFLANVAGPAGTLLVLDDLQWAGPDALDLLATLVRPLGAAAVRIVGTYRETDIQPHDALATVLADLARTGLAQQRALAPLSGEDAGQLLDSLLADSSDTSALVRSQVVARAGGVPFFLVSFAQGLQRGEDAVPWTLAQGVRHRVAGLSERTRAVLGAAAVIGRVVPHELLQATTDDPATDLVAALEEAHHARLLEQETARTYRFVHDVIREVVEADLAPMRRLTLHRQIAQALERQPGEPAVELLAYHFGRCGDQEKAVQYLWQVADRARMQHAHVAAEATYRDLAQVLDQIGQPSEAATARETLGVILGTMARHDEALAVLDQAADAFRRLGDREGLGRTMAEIGRAHAMRGTPEEGLTRLHPVLDLLVAHPPTRALGTLHAALALLSYFCGRYDDELTEAGRAAAVAQRLQDTRGVAVATYHQGMAQVFMGRIDEGLRTLATASAQAEVVGDLNTVCEILDPVGYTNVLQSAFEAATACYDRAVQIATLIDDPGWLANMISHRGGPAFYAGHWTQAAADFERGVALSREVGSWLGLVYTLGYRAELRLRVGDWVAAAEDLDEMDALLASAHDLNPLRGAQALRAELDLLHDQPEAAQSRLISVRDRPGLEEMDVTRFLPIVAWTYLDLGEVATATEVVRHAVRRARSQGLRLVLVDALRTAAMVALRQGARETAEQSMQEGLRLARSLPYPYAEGRLLHLSSEMHVQKGEPGVARDRLEEALAIYQRLGARTDAACVAQAIKDLSSRA